MSEIHLKVNGRAHSVDVDPATPLLYVLSDELKLNGAKFGCGLGQCGACTVIVRDEAIRSCVTPVTDVAGAEITTSEGLGTPEKPHPIQQAFIARTGLAVWLLPERRHHDRQGPGQEAQATDAEIRQALSASCAVVSHMRMHRAIKQYAQRRA
jgi:aerobic-type carbon monoxide dehydrogenase small subunit (CoxS/CutS family)